MSFDRRLFTTDSLRCVLRAKRHLSFGLWGITILISLTVSVFAEPVIISFEAKLDGENVIQAPPNSTITLTAVAEDPDGNPLSFAWSVNAGTITSSSGSEAQWQLPISGGLHFAYVFVTNSNNEKVQGGVTISTDGSAIFGSQAVPAPTVSDRIPQSDHFLSSAGLSEKNHSCQYYLTIGTGGVCDEKGELKDGMDFKEWKNKWGLNDPTVGARAIYANKADLNLQRNMHGVSNANGTAYYVCNYPRVDDLDEGANLDNAIHNLNLAACVAMENSSDGNSTEKFTKFYVFGPSGDLLQSVNLDGRGEKYIPGSCVVCHGGSSFPPYKGSSFLPFDLDNFVFSSHPGLTKPEQQSSLRQLNEWIRDFTNPKPAIVELINGWYSDSNITFKSDFAPPDWESKNKELYINVVKPYCRTCHVALNRSFSTFGSLPNPSFESFTFSASRIDTAVCGNDNTNSNANAIYKMPNARVAFDHFWESPAAIEALKNFLLDQKNSVDPDLQHISGVCNPPQ